MRFIPSSHIMDDIIITEAKPSRKQVLSNYKKKSVLGKQYATDTATSAAKRYKKTYQKKDPKLLQPIVKARWVNPYKAKGYYNTGYTTKKLINMILDPTNNPDYIRYPNSIGHSGITCTNDEFTANFCAAGDAYDNQSRSTVIVHPYLANAIYSTSAITGGKPLSTQDTSGLGEYGVNQTVNLPSNINKVSWLNAPWDIGGTNVLLSHQDATESDVTCYNFIFQSAQITAGAAMKINLTGIPDGNVTVHVRQYTNAQLNNFVDHSYNSGNEIINVTLNAVLTYAIAVGIQNDGPLNIQSGLVNAWISYNGPVGGPYPTIVANSDSFLCVEQNLSNSAIGIANWSEGFVVAQSLLCTFEGSTLNDGGQIATGRVPAGTYIGEAENTGKVFIYDWLNSLNKNTFNGPFRNGAYSWWLGDDESDYFYQGVGYSDFGVTKPYLITDAIQQTTQAASMRVQIRTVYQFKTVSTMFETQVSDYIGQDRLKIHHILSCIPSSYENKSHTQQIKDFLAKAGQKVFELVKDPNTYATAAQIMAKVASVAAMFL